MARADESDGLEPSEASARKEPQREPGAAPKQITIYVNAEAHVVSDKDISFEEVIGLTSGLPTGPEILYGVTYQRGQGNKPTGTLVAGQTTKVKDGMIFSVTATDRS